MTISSGMVDMSTNSLTVNSTLGIYGTLKQSSGTLTAGTITVGSTGTWVDTSSGTVLVGAGGVTNNGLINFDGSGVGCGGADIITLGSTAGQRTWAGSGQFLMYDVAVASEAGSAPVYVYSGSNNGNNGGNWHFAAFS